MMINLSISNQKLYRAPRPIPVPLYNNNIDMDAFAQFSSSSDDDDACSEPHPRYNPKIQQHTEHRKVHSDRHKQFPVPSAPSVHSVSTAATQPGGVPSHYRRQRRPPSVVSSLSVDSYRSSSTIPPVNLQARKAAINQLNAVRIHSDQHQPVAAPAIPPPLLSPAPSSYHYQPPQIQRHYPTHNQSQRPQRPQVVPQYRNHNQSTNRPNLANHYEVKRDEECYPSSNANHAR